MIAPTMDVNFERAKDFFLQGVRHYEAGRFEQAQAQFVASLALVPGRASTLTNLGATRLKLGRYEEADHVLEEALRAEPGNVEALGHRATALAELGRHQEALACAEAALAIDPSPPALWTLRGNLLKDLGRPAEAAAAFRESLARGGDGELNRFYLSGLTSADAPDAPPRGYVQALFDGYADGFEQHLVQVLHYRAPEILVEGLGKRRFNSALDLGCGTGLCGLALRPHVQRLVGVDLSANMVAQARSRGVYDEVVQGDVLDYLEGVTSAFDLVMAADVFIYVGALERVFNAVQKVLTPGGVFAFTVELAGEEAPVSLRSSLRYSHSRGYIQSLAEQVGFQFLHTAEHPIRDDQRTPVPGLFAWLARA